MKKFIKLFAILFLLSCASGPKFISPSFTYVALRDGGLAILPVGGEVGDREIKLAAGLGFEKKINEKTSELKITGIDYASNILLKSNLIDTYSSLLTSYQLTGAFSSDKLNSIGNSLECRYLAIPLIKNYEKEKEKDNNDYKYTVVLELKIWDTESNQTVFDDVTKGESTPSGWAFGLFGSSPEKAAKSAGEKAAKHLIKAIVPKE